MGTAVLVARRDAGGGLVLVGLDVDEETARSYTTAGQYVEVRAPKGNGYFVLAGDEGARRFELLVRNAGDAADALVNGPLGSSFTISNALGAGFPVHEAKGRPVIVAVVGSALAAARPVLRRRLLDGDAAVTQIFIGVRAVTDLPLAAEVEQWAEDGVHVVLCLSRGELHHHEGAVPRAARSAGYVQVALERAVDAGTVPNGALVVAAGPEAMLASMRALAARGTVEVVTNV